MGLGNIDYHRRVSHGVDWGAVYALLIGLGLKVQAALLIEVQLEASRELVLECAVNSYAAFTHSELIPGGTGSLLLAVKLIGSLNSPASKAQGGKS